MQHCQFAPPPQLTFVGGTGAAVVSTMRAATERKRERESGRVLLRALQRCRWQGPVTIGLRGIGVFGVT